MILIVMGVSGVGKSTVAQAIAKRTGWPMVEGDDLHPPANIAKMSAGHPLDDADRLPWLLAIRQWIEATNTAGSNGIVTCSALKRTYRDLLRGDRADLDTSSPPATQAPAPTDPTSSNATADVRFICLMASHQLLQDRLTHRQGHFMPPSLLDSQLATFEPLQPDEPGLVLDISPDDGAAESLGELVDTVMIDLGLQEGPR
jgi:gluconokinase